MEYTLGRLCAVVKPKYRVISTILGESFNPQKGLDVFVDLNSVVDSSTSSQKYMNAMAFSSDVAQDMIASILMILKHWKDYCRKYDNVRIFMIINDFEMDKMFEQEQLKSYMLPHMNKYANERFNQLKYYWVESLNRIEVIMKYIPGSYLIRCKKCDSYIIPNILENYETSGRRRIVVSGSSLMTNYHYMPNTNIIYSRYRYTGMSQLSDPLMIVQSLAKIDEPIMETFTKNKVFYNLLNAIVGDKQRGLIGLTQLGITGFAETLLRAVEKRDIPENPLTIDSVLPVIKNDYHDYLKQVYPLIDIDDHSKMIPQSHITEIKSNMIDLYDIDGLKSITVQDLNLLELL